MSKIIDVREKKVSKKSQEEQNYTHIKVLYDNIEIVQRFLLLEILSSTLNLNVDVISNNFYALHVLSARPNFHIIMYIVMIRNDKSIRLYVCLNANYWIKFIQKQTPRARIIF